MSEAGGAVAAAVGVRRLSVALETTIGRMGGDAFGPTGGVCPGRDGTGGMGSGRAGRPGEGLACPGVPGECPFPFPDPGRPGVACDCPFPFPEPERPGVPCECPFPFPEPERPGPCELPFPEPPPGFGLDPAGRPGDPCPGASFGVSAGRSVWRGDSLLPP
jgi:hypothetical protein